MNVGDMIENTEQIEALPLGSILHRTRDGAPYNVYERVEEGLRCTFGGDLGPTRVSHLGSISPEIGRYRIERIGPETPAPVHGARLNTLAEIRALPIGTQVERRTNNHRAVKTVFEDGLMYNEGLTEWSLISPNETVTYTVHAPEPQAPEQEDIMPNIGDNLPTRASVQALPEGSKVRRSAPSGRNVGVFTTTPLGLTGDEGQEFKFWSNIRPNPERPTTYTLVSVPFTVGQVITSVEMMRALPVGAVVRHAGISNYTRVEGGEMQTAGGSPIAFIAFDMSIRRGQVILQSLPDSSEPEVPVDETPVLTVGMRVRVAQNPGTSADGVGYVDDSFSGAEVTIMEGSAGYTDLRVRAVQHDSGMINGVHENFLHPIVEGLVAYAPYTHLAAGVRVVRVSDEHHLSDRNQRNTFGDRECHRCSIGTTTRASSTDGSVGVRWDEDRDSAIAVSDLAPYTEPVAEPVARPFQQGDRVRVANWASTQAGQRQGDFTSVGSSIFGKVGLIMSTTTSGPSWQVQPSDGTPSYWIDPSYLTLVSSEPEVPAHLPVGHAWPVNVRPTKEEAAALPIGTVVRSATSGYTYRKDATGWGQYQDGGRLHHARSLRGHGLNNGSHFIIESIPDSLPATPAVSVDSTTPIPRQETIRQYKQRVWAACVGAAQAAWSQSESAITRLEELGLRTLDLEPGHWVHYYKGRSDIPNGTMALRGTEIVMDNHGYWERVVRGTYDAEGGQMMQVITVPGVERPAWVDEVGTAADAEAIREFKSRAWRVGYAAKISNSWCGDFERAMRLVEIDASSEIRP